MRNVQVSAEHCYIRVCSDSVEVVTTLMGCRGDALNVTTSTRVVRKLSGLIQQLKCSVPVLTRWKARGFPSPECDSDNSNPLFVVGGRAETPAFV